MRGSHQQYVEMPRVGYSLLAGQNFVSNMALNVLRDGGVKSIIYIHRLPLSQQGIVSMPPWNRVGYT